MLLPLIKFNRNSKTSTLANQRGQTFFEFILLLLIVVAISTVMFRGFRSGIKGYWQGAIMLLCTHGQTIDSLRNECSVVID